MYAVDLTGKTAIVFGVANHRSIAWAIAQILHQAGARLIIAYQNDRVRDTVEKLVEKWEGTILVECDVTEDSNVASVYSSIGQEIDTLDIIVHSIAYANKDDLGGAFLEPVSINESVDRTQEVVTEGRVCTKYCKLEGLVHDILSEIGDIK